MLRNHTPDILIKDGTKGEPGFSTIFYQGITGSQTQVTRYTPHTVTASTGEKMSSTGRNNLPPLDVLINPYIGPEISDVNTNPYNSWRTALSPVTWIATGTTRIGNWYYGVNVASDETRETVGTVKCHAPVVSEISVSQETDIESHYQKYLSWKRNAREDDNLVLYGVSRGAGTTFNAMAKYKYPEAKLVILEGCYSSIEDVLEERFGTFSGYVSSGLSLFTKYHKDGPSPMKCVDDFPAGVPVVFITSKIDREVPSTTTRRLANALAEKNRNDVYLLELESSRHPTYMYDNIDDRNNYEAFIHAIYRKYGCPHQSALADKGQELMERCQCRTAQSLKM